MKKGNFRTKKIYPKKGIFRFCVEHQQNGLWKLINDKSGAWIFDTETEAAGKIIDLFELKHAVTENLKKVGIEMENLKTRAE